MSIISFNKCVQVNIKHTNKVHNPTCILSSLVNTPSVNCVTEKQISLEL